MNKQEAAQAGAESGFSRGQDPGRSGDKRPAERNSEDAKSERRRRVEVATGVEEVHVFKQHNLWRLLKYG